MECRHSSINGNESLHPNSTNVTKIFTVHSTTGTASKVDTHVLRRQTSILNVPQHEAASSPSSPSSPKTKADDCNHPTFDLPRGIVSLVEEPRFVSN